MSTKNQQEAAAKRPEPLPWEVVQRHIETHRLRIVDIANAIGESRQTVDMWRSRGYVPKAKSGKVQAQLGIEKDALHPPRPSADAQESDAAFKTILTLARFYAFTPSQCTQVLAVISEQLKRIER